jgi:hypothetical protein
MKFIITGTGRCGTMFLSSLMNRGGKYTVLHEPVGTADSFDKAEARFRNEKNYGEVNAQLVSFADRISGIDKIGVIIRHPVAVIDSWLRRNKYNQDIERIIPYMNELLNHMDRLIEKGAYKIYFNDLTHKIDYLNSTVRCFGIDDVTYTEDDMYRVKNKGRGESGEGLEVLSVDEYLTVYRETDWFFEKHAP